MHHPRAWADDDPEHLPVWDGPPVARGCATAALVLLCGLAIGMLLTLAWLWAVA